MKTIIVSMVAALASSLCVQAQSSPPEFEVASVKRSPPGDTIFVKLGSSGGRFFAIRITFRTLLQLAYEPDDDNPLLDSRLIGAPSWIDEDRFDVEAKTEDASLGPIPRKRLQPMLQSLLEDRFHLKTHREMREMPVYHLVLKDRSKIRLSKDQTPPATPDPPTALALTAPPTRGTVQIRPAALPERGLIVRGAAIPVWKLANLLPLYVRRPVIEQTHLEGLFDIELQFMPVWEMTGTNVAPPTAQPSLPDPSGTSIFTALQEQLGLRLESAKGPVDVLVIDHVERPSEN